MKNKDVLIIIQNLVGSFMRIQLQKTQMSQKTISHIVVCRAFLADHFGNKNARLD
jgi:hypothetical protein